MVVCVVVKTVVRQVILIELKNLREGEEEEIVQDERKDRERDSWKRAKEKGSEGQRKG